MSLKINSLLKGITCLFIVICGYASEYQNISEKNFDAFLNTSLLQAPLALDKNTQWVLGAQIPLFNLSLIHI